MRKIIPLGILAALLTLLVALPVSAGGPAGDPPGLARAIAAQEAHTDALLARAGVVGTGVGLGPDGSPVIVIFTEAAGIAGLPRSLNGIPVTVKVTGKVFAADRPNSDKEHSHSTSDDGNSAPAADDQSVDTAENMNVIITLTGSDADGCGATFTLAITQSPTPGSLSNIGGVTCVDDGNLSAAVTYEPTSSGSFSDSFDFTIDDGTDTSNTATVSITVGTVTVKTEIGTSSGTERLIDVNGSLFCTVGTLGASLNSGAFVLSNAHIYALQGATPNGGAVTTSDRILQPGRVDLSSGCGTDDEIDDAVIGDLSAWVEISFSSNNTVDAAIASTNSPGDIGDSTPSDGYGAPKTATLTADLALGQNVQKYGRTSGLTTGTITAINVTVNVGYDNGTATFTDQLFIEGKGGFLQSGDSGSLLVIDGGTDDLKPVGLLFASSFKGNGKWAFANEIDNVLAAFPGTSIDGDAA